MEREDARLDPNPLKVRPISYQYRFCPRCHRELPARYESCPECAHWLGESPLMRTEWQLVPVEDSRTAVARSYDLIGASALILRIICPSPPSDVQQAGLVRRLDEILAAAGGTAFGIAEHGWLVWTREGLRQSFRQACEIEQRLASASPRFGGALQHIGQIRWGMWLDQYLVPIDAENRLMIGNIAAQAIFNFEPDGFLLSSEAIYQANRGWENFVCVPRRLRNGQEASGYRMLSHKRPSAFDHAEVAASGAFVGRQRQLSYIENCWKRVGSASIRLAITAPAGSGKTRMVREWLGRHRDVKAATANFSLFGGGVEGFASQLADLPADGLNCHDLVKAVAGHIVRENIRLLFLDDFHWADASGVEFAQALLSTLPSKGMLVILAARPSGRRQLRALKANAEVTLSPLSKQAAELLARQLTTSDTIVSEAVARSGGKPLFVEQFAAWAAETNFRGSRSGPHTLYQVIAARIAYLSNVRIADIRDRLRWGRSWQRKAVNDELASLEMEVGRWLDRLETGDYADRVETARHLVSLERLDYEIFMTSMLVGRPRPRSGRLREAIERLLLGSAEEILAYFTARTVGAKQATRQNISDEAKRIADVLFAAFRWSLAAKFYELARSGAFWDKSEIERLLAQCRLHGKTTIHDDDSVYSMWRGRSLEEKPDIDALNLPYAWAELARVCHSRGYFLRASEAAAAINDTALCAWARHKADEVSEYGPFKIALA